LLSIQYLNDGLYFTEFQHTVFSIEHEPVETGFGHDFGNRGMT